MIKKLPDYIELFSEQKNMFEKEMRPLIITMQIKEHFVRLDTDQPGFDILCDSLRDIPFELLRYSADETINIGLKYWESV